MKQTQIHLIFFRASSWAGITRCPFFEAVEVKGCDPIAVNVGSIYCVHSCPYCVAANGEAFAVVCSHPGPLVFSDPEDKKENENTIYPRPETKAYKALSVKQPYAEALARGHKTIEVRSRNTNYRGELIICSSAKPAIPGLLSGVTCCAVELYDVKRIEDFTAEDWRATCIPPEDRPLEGFGWLVRNPRPVKTVRVKGQLGIYNLNVPEL